MLKEFAQYLAAQNIKPEDRIQTIADEVFVIDANGEPHKVTPRLPLAKESLIVHTLTSVVDYLLHANDRVFANKLILQIRDPYSIKLTSALQPDGSREDLLVAKALTPQIDFDYFMDIEELNIALQAKFVPTDDSKTILKVIGNIKEENVHSTGDDGVSQVVTAKTGVATVSNIKVPNPVVLAPFRTFSEVQQPESAFVFRMKDGPRGALFEADGGAWRLKAIQNIKAYLEKELAEMIKADKLAIIA
ncbi:hypothetical protein FC83_GL000934 [Agrilactobacillus composti DSM 18527 = JCM 14202]|uniref:Phage protein n=1 Tax=Agrilactobacillus composti DSM 18527 = JCM 14202 TaxID=1423734 RepID=X0PGT8_9LACO|nr:hypothetical protein [Agrilactobacillus composti]KRM35630.1 hypothetical protein FC83_GL000934 [Agrilactobacillus composti DSM 18527 = JCM 14202]GAF41148.1 phage-related protein [Agrilactobacillus composti DSM 18527 = JCM 14202]